MQSLGPQLNINMWGCMSIKRDDNPEDDIQAVSVIPGQSMGDLRLGMRREDLFKALKIDLNPSSDNPELFSDIGLRVEYKDGQVITLESDCSWPLFWDDFDIFDHSFSDSIVRIQQEDPEAIVKEDSYVTSKKLGIGIMANQSPDQPPYLVAIFSSSSNPSELSSFSHFEREE